MSKSWKSNSTKKMTIFREWFEKMKDEGLASEVEVEAGTFKQSGTSIETMMVIICKP
jgi:hypothetical protein